MFEALEVYNQQLLQMYKDAEHQALTRIKSIVEAKVQALNTQRERELELMRITSNAELDQITEDEDTRQLLRKIDEELLVENTVSNITAEQTRNFVDSITCHWRQSSDLSLRLLKGRLRNHDERLMRRVESYDRRLSVLVSLLPQERVSEVMEDAQRKKEAVISSSQISKSLSFADLSSRDHKTNEKIIERIQDLSLDDLDCKIRHPLQ